MYFQIIWSLLESMFVQNFDIFSMIVTKMCETVSFVSQTCKQSFILAPSFQNRSSFFLSSVSVKKNNHLLLNWAELNRTLWFQDYLVCEDAVCEDAYFSWVRAQVWTHWKCNSSRAGYSIGSNWSEQIEFEPEFRKNYEKFS